MKNVPDPSPNLKTSLLPSHSIIIVGLSGGPDSIYLLHQLHLIKDQRNVTIIAAHLDHEWQESSKIAVKICKQACDDLGITLIVKKLSEIKFEAKWNGSQEELGRNMRRHFFTTLAHQYQASAIVLAHHQQDQQETFFIRLLRGCSLTGLTGIHEQEGLYIRPILDCTKQEIFEYLHHHKITYYTDPTNSSNNYLRNRIRNNVIPALQLADARFSQKLISTMDHLIQVDNFLDQHVTKTLAMIGTDQGIELQKFLSLHSVLQQRILLHLMITEHVTFSPSQKLFKEIMRFLEKSASNKHTIHDSWMVEKNKSHFMIKNIDLAIMQCYDQRNTKLQKNEKTL
ncbi:MAG: tRNA lysidine(34) synthetase TilS [Candidatus Chromulinivorax sp.]|nr:tRNA lysidine(34) synthetase TilS [Candidatus Chromulinivorax sp.]